MQDFTRATAHLRNGDDRIAKATARAIGHKMRRQKKEKRSIKHTSFLINIPSCDSQRIWWCGEQLTSEHV